MTSKTHPGMNTATRFDREPIAPTAGASTNVEVFRPRPTGLNRRQVAGSIGALVLLLLTLFPVTLDGADVLAITDANVIDGTGRPLLTNMTLIIG